MNTLTWTGQVTCPCCAYAHTETKTLGCFTPESSFVFMYNIADSLHSAKSWFEFLEKHEGVIIDSKGRPYTLQEIKIFAEQAKLMPLFSSLDNEGFQIIKMP